MMTPRLTVLAAASLVIIFTAGSTAAQVTTGTLVGTVRAPNGIVPGANVTVREVNRGTSGTVVTDETGSYTAPFLSPGTYIVEVNVPGFKKWVRDGVILQVNQRARVNVTLILYGPGHTNFDTSLSKRFAIAGRTNAEFRWDAFNLFNHPGFGFPNQNFDSTTAGRLTSTIVDNRSLQFSLKMNF